MSGTLYDRHSLPPDLAIRFGTSLGLSPVCYVRERPLLLHQLAALGRAAEVLGYSGFDAAAAADAVAAIGGAGSKVALVPTPTDHRAGPPGDEWTLAAAPFAAPDASRPLRLGVSAFRRNHRSPTSNALVVGDGELLAGAREAAAAGRDDVVWSNLDDAVSCAGTAALFADLDGRVVTPPLRDGVPDSAWRDAAIAQLGVTEQRVDLGDLRRATSVACLWPWGTAQAVASIDDASIDDTSIDDTTIGDGTLPARIAAALVVVGAT